MKNLVMLLLVLALCAPSFGAILVYKQSVSMKGFNFDVNEYTKDVTVDIEDPCDANQTPPLEVDTKTLTSAQDATAKLIGYVVMDVDVNTLLINDNDINDTNALKPYNIAAEADGAAIIIVDKKAKTFKVIRETRPASAADANVFGAQDANFGSISAEMHNAVVVLNKKGTATKKTLAVVDVGGALLSNKNTDLDDTNDANASVDSDKNEYKSQEFELGTMTGALKKVDVDGSKTKVLVPTSLKGHAFSETTEGIDISRDVQYRDTNQANETFQEDKTLVETESDVYVNTELVGTGKLTLDKKATQAANQDTPTTKGTVAVLEAALVADGFTKVLPPAVPYID